MFFDNFRICQKKYEWQINWSTPSIFICMRFKTENMMLNPTSWTLLPINMVRFVVLVNFDIYEKCLLSLLEYQYELFHT